LLWNDTAVAIENKASGNCDEASLVASDQHESAAELDGDDKCQRRHRQADGGNHLRRCTVSSKFAEAAHGERKADQQTAYERKIAGSVHGVYSFC